MNDGNDFDEGASEADSPRGREHPKNGHAHGANGHSRHPARYSPRDRREPAAKTIDGWFFIELLLPRWHWVFLSCFVLALAGWSAGMLAWKKTYAATAQLLRFEPIANGDFFKPQPISSDTFASLLKSPELLEQVATNLQPPLSPELLAKCVLIKCDADSDMVKVLVKGYDPHFAVNTANIYAGQAVDYTRELQKREAEAINRAYIQERVTQMDKDISGLEKQFRALPQSTLLMGKLNQLGGAVTNLGQQLQNPATSYTAASRLTEKLLAAEDELAKLSRKFTDENPLVQQQRAEVSALENEVAKNTNSAALLGGPNSAQLFNPDYEIIHGKLAALATSRQLLADRQQEAKAFLEDPPGNVRFFSPATLRDITPDHRWMKVGLLTVFSGVAGILFALGGIFLVEFLDSRLKTSSDVQRVTKLPVIATLDNLDDKSLSSREQWAFRTWTMLQGRLSPSPNHGLVCGITSSSAGEGRSTWINLLADAASLSGFRVLTIATRPTNEEGSEPFEMPGCSSPEETETNPNAIALSTNALTCPSEVTQQLTGPNARPSVHIPLPGWVWNLERRKQWQDALEQWRSVENLVIFVELPPGSVPEAVLLGENLPNIVWLTGSGQADAAETRLQLETLRHAKCNLVGAVLNRQPSIPLKTRFPRWMGCVGLGLICLMAFDSAKAQQVLPSAPKYENPPSNTIPTYPSTNYSFSITSPSQRSEWQKRLTLGPGDLLNISVYGQPDLTRSDVLVGPDGRLSFLEAQNVLATGMTVDELRTNLDQELGKYRRAPRTIITPAAYRSKRYYMLGRVVQRGVFVLDRPITVIEAVARAHGLEMGISGRNSLDLADFQRCFLMRNGKRIPLNFEDLFLRGDLSQNIPVEPGDYLYFPPASVSEVYVLGEVKIPGPVPYNSDMNIISALAARGGFTDVAYKTHVLVLRGSFSHPKGFVVDTEDIVYGRAMNFKLEPHDIIYVSGRPFLRAEQLLDLAMSAFLQSATAEFTGKIMGNGLSGQ